jgi:phage terminase large subunit-like protein
VTGFYHITPSGVGGSFGGLSISSCHPGFQESIGRVFLMIISPLRGLADLSVVYLYHHVTLSGFQESIGRVFLMITSPLRGLADLSVVYLYHHVTPSGFQESIGRVFISLCHPFGVWRIFRWFIYIIMSPQG